MDDLDFSKSQDGSKPLPKPAPAAAYDGAISRAFFESAGKPDSAPAGHVFFREHDKASRIFLQRDKMYLLLEGEVALTARGRAIGTVRPGEIFGELAAITESPRSATATATAACRFIALDDRAFKDALSRKPEFAIMLMGLLIGRLRAMLAGISGIPTASANLGAKETSVFDKALLEHLVEGLGGQCTVHYERGKVIMVAGQAGTLMYVVLEGRVAITLRGALVERVGPGGVFGEMALLDQAGRAADAAAETECVLLAINRNVFLHLVKSDPTFGLSLLTSVAERVRTTASGFL